MDFFIVFYDQIIFVFCRPPRNIWYHMFFQCWSELLMTMIPGYKKKFCVEQCHCLVNLTSRLPSNNLLKQRLIIQFCFSFHHEQKMVSDLLHGLQHVSMHIMHSFNDYFFLQLVKQAVLPRVHGLALKTTVAAVCVYNLVY